MKLRIWSALIAVYIAWGSTYLAIRFAVESMPPFLMAATRFLVAGAILYAWRRLSGDRPPRRIEWRSAAVVGLLLLAGANGSVTWAEQYVVSGVAALLVGAVPLWMFVLEALLPARWLSGGRPEARVAPSWQVFAGVAIGFAGIALLSDPVNLIANFREQSSLGIAALLLAGLLWSLGSLYSRGAQLPESPLMGTAAEMLIGGAGLLALGSLNGEWGQLQLSAVSTRSLLGLGYLIVFGSLVGFAAYTWLLRNAPTPLVSTYAYVNPLIAIFMGYFLAQEPLTARILIAAGLIVGSVMLITTARSRPRKNAAAPEPQAVAACAGED